jgi:hypothetical protein
MPRITPRDYARLLRHLEHDGARRGPCPQGAVVPAVALADPTPERAIQDACIAWLTVYGWAVWQTSQPQVALMTAGLSDLLALHPAYGVVFIEVKSATGSQRPSQRLFEAACRWAGVPYLVAHSAAELAAQCAGLPRRERMVK